MDISKLRLDFKLLQGADAPIYFDNACMTLKPEPVLTAMDEYNRNYPTCGGRSLNHLGQWVTAAVASARDTVAEFIGAADSSEIIFFRNTTEGINLLAHSIAFTPTDVIVTSDKEHNSNLVPWQRAAEKAGAKHTIVRTNPDGTFYLEALREILEQGNVKVVALTMVSNLDGVTIPAADIIALVHQYNALVVLDAAQAAPHLKLDVVALDVDYLVFSGHKLCGPSGTGVLYGKKVLLNDLEPFMTGGSTVSDTTYTSYTMLPAPEKFEAGLQDYAGIIGLAAAVRYVTDIGLDTIAEHQTMLNTYATKQVMALPGCTIVGPADASQRSGILSFMVAGVDMHQIAIVMDSSSGVALRSGQHCVHSWFNDRQLPGCVRASFYLYNTTNEVDRFAESLKRVIAVYA